VTSRKATPGIIYSAAMTFASTSSLFEKKNAVYYFQISLYISQIFKTWSEFSNISQSMRTRYGCKHLHHTTELISWRWPANAKQNMERKNTSRSDNLNDYCITDNHLQKKCVSPSKKVFGTLLLSTSMYMRE